MRLLVVDTCYPPFLRAHYLAHPGLAGRPYEAQWQALMGTYFGTADAYSHYLGLLGHEAHEVVVNCLPLQRAWARENGIRTGLVHRLSGGRLGGITHHQAARFEPDVVYVQDVRALSPRALGELRRSARLLVGQIATELPPWSQLEPFDLLVTSFPHYVTTFRERGIAAELLRIGFDPRVLDHVRDVPVAHDTVFVGSLARRRWETGNEALEQAARIVPVEFWGYGLDGWPDDSPLVRSFHGEAWGLDMYRVLAGSRIALNRHGEVAAGHANNMRLFEATGVGTLLLTDERTDLDELFVVGDEVVTYRDGRDLAEKAAYYLSHDEERLRAAAAGQRRTLAEHTYAVRMRELTEILQAYL